MVKTIQVKKLDKMNGTLPTRAHPEDAGLDIYASKSVSYNPGEIILVPTSVAIDIPKGTVGMVRDRSSMGKKGLKVTAGIIDAGYTGEVNVVLLNLSGKHGCIQKGDRIAQLLILPIALPEVIEVDEFTTHSERGGKGFGSTGR